jgi:hypothetical protein
MFTNSNSKANSGSSSSSGGANSNSSGAGNNVVINKVFAHYSVQGRTAIFVLVCLCMPVEWVTDDTKSTNSNDIADNTLAGDGEEPVGMKTWSRVCLRKFIDELEIPEHNIEAYEQLIPHSFPDNKNEEEQELEREMKTRDIANSFLAVLESEHKRDLMLVVEVCVFLALSQLLDARGMTLVRNLTKYFPGSINDKIAIEYMLGE